MNLIDIWQAGVAAVRGDAAVRTALSGGEIAGVDRVLAIGKAACDMARAATEFFPDAPVLILTKHGHSVDAPAVARVIEAGHPVPDEASLQAGAAAQEWVGGCGTDDHLLLLVSGGASAVAEVLPAGMTLADWQNETETMIASGADIHAINTRRREISQIKGGKLLAAFRGAQVTTLAISDVEGDSISVIGSGIGAAPERRDFDYRLHLVASNAHARGAAARASDAAVICNEETLYDDIANLAPRLAQTIKAGDKGIYIFGGEPTVRLPSNPGRGGRNQALALMLAREIAGTSGIEILVAGTDGSDGPTEDAGGRVDGSTWGDGAQDALDRADAGTYLARRDALVTTGPTGTNVMDLMIARKS